jgi:hypothetical protein
LESQPFVADESIYEAALSQLKRFPQEAAGKLSKTLN